MVAVVMAATQSHHHHCQTLACRHVRTRWRRECFKRLDAVCCLQYNTTERTRFQGRADSPVTLVGASDLRSRHGRVTRSYGVTVRQRAQTPTAVKDPSISLSLMKNAQPPTPGRSFQYEPNRFFIRLNPADGDRFCRFCRLIVSTKNLRRIQFCSM